MALCVLELVCTFALIVPGVWSFGIAMIAMATLYVVTSVPATSAASHRPQSGTSRTFPFAFRS